MLKDLILPMMLIAILAEGVFAQQAGVGRFGETRTEKIPAIPEQRGQGTGGQEMRGQMMQNPHRMLAMAYKNNLVTFARMLQQQVQKSDGVDRKLAEPAVAEMKRNLEQMKNEHDEAMKSMPQQMQQKMESMEQMMETRFANLQQHLEVLEGEVKSEAPDAKKVLAQLDQLLQQCAMMPMNGMNMNRPM